jgi:hypothetical protein
MSEFAGVARASRRNPQRIHWLAPAILGLLGICPALAGAETEVAGVEIASSVTVAGQNLVLNGAGVRKKFFFKIYVGALYLPRRTSAAEEALGMEGPKRVLMHFVYKKVTADQLVDGWNEGFEKNRAPEDLRPLLERFNAMFGDVRKGDEILLDYLPGKGTQVTIRGENKGLIPGEDFYRALLNIWLGDKPADKGLKKAMLGD